jgi:hypothetical protein
MSNYLYKTLLSLLFIMMPYMNSTSKAMNDGHDEGSTVLTHKVSLIREDQKDISSSVSQAKSSINLEDSQTSWRSYLLSPVQSVIKRTSEKLYFPTPSRQKALYVGFCLAYQVASVAAQVEQFDCLCGYSHNGRPVNPFLTLPLHEAHSACMQICEETCQATNLTFFGERFNYFNWSCVNYLN